MPTITPKVYKLARNKLVVNLILTFQGEFGSAANAGRYHIVFAFFVSLMFAISLGSLFGYHCYLVANNRTTLGWYFGLCHSCTGNKTKLQFINVLKWSVN